MGESFNSPRTPTPKTTNLPSKNHQKTKRPRKQSNTPNKTLLQTPNKLLSRNNNLIDIVPTPMVISPQPETRTTTVQKPTPQAHNYALTEVLDDLLIRFILNCPEEEHESMDRLFFQLEEAHWFYEDFYRENCKTLPELKFRDFVEKMFHHCPLLAPYRQLVDSHTKSFYLYKTSVPVCGAIILNKHMNKVLLVKGWSAKSSWSFPRGKINKDEKELSCAVREVYEETGFDISLHGANENDFVEMVLAEQKVKLFIVAGVSESTVFTPQTRKEISATEWHTFEQVMERNPTTQKTSGKYWAVAPFVRKLKKFIAQNKKRLLRAGRESPEKMSVSPPRHTQNKSTSSCPPPSQPINMNNSFVSTPPQQQEERYAFNYPQQQYQHYINAPFDMFGYAAQQQQHHVLQQQYQNVPAHYGYNHVYNMVSHPGIGMNQQYATDSLLSFSFNMNDIFEDSAVKNVYA